MDSPYRLQPINSHADHAEGAWGLWRPEQHPWFPVLGAEPEPYSQRSRTSSFQSYYTAPYAERSRTSSFQSYYTAHNTRPSHSHSQSYNSRSTDSSQSRSRMNSSTTSSSNMSFPYSVTSINSRKSRKNVLYPRRAHPVPVAVSSEHLSVSTDALIWQVRFLCTTLLPHAETRLVPAGRVLLESLGLHGDFSQRVPIQTDKETRCCAELFIALTHEVLLKDAVSAKELEGPCKLLHTTFKDILFKSGTFSFLKTPKSNEMGLKTPITGALALQQFSGVLLTFFSVLNTFEEALNTIKIKPATTKDGALGDHYRMALLELSVSTGLTMEQYRKKLDQNLAQTQAQLNSFLRKPDSLLPPSTRAMPVILPYKGAPLVISTIDEVSEGDSEGSPTKAWSHSAQSHSDTSGKDSLSRRILRRLIPSSIGRKEG